ncbi:hypothetical protein K1719_035497 [Acacia pycnantha]|nr:hypothetical protein K1719_035497 [Acacia pycnantha]
MNSAGNSKKRKIWCGEDEEEEDDEIKMEKFFALIRSIRESREGLRRFGETQNGSSKLKNRVGVWKPQFQIEDFMEADPHHQNRSQKYDPPLNFSPADLPHGNQKAASDEKKEAERGMNLGLSL